jgi:hypothetical protein
MDTLPRPLMVMATPPTKGRCSSRRLRLTAGAARALGGEQVPNRDAYAAIVPTTGICSLYPWVAEELMVRRLSAGGTGFEPPVRGCDESGFRPLLCRARLFVRLLSEAHPARRGID